MWSWGIQLQKVRLHLTKWWSWNNRDENWKKANSLLCGIFVVVADRNKRELKQRPRRRQRGRQKSNMFRLAKQQLCTCMTFLLYISSPSLHDYDAKRPIIISSFMVDVNKRQRFSFSFRELRYSPLEFNSWKNRQQLTNYCKRVGIRAMTFEASRIHFFGDVFAAVAVVPTIWQRRRQWNWKKYYASFQTFSLLFHVAYLL